MPDPTDQITILCPHCGKENGLDAVDHQQCCHTCRGEIPVKRTDKKHYSEQ